MGNMISSWWYGSKKEQKVPLEQAWKEGDVSSEEARQEVLQSVFNKSNAIPGACQQLNVLLIGNMFSGKSSFTNTLKTAIKEVSQKHIDTTAVVHGLNHSSVTVQLNKTKLELGNGSKVHLYDCRGFKRQAGDEHFPLVKDVEKVIMGHIADSYMFKENEEIDQNDQSFRQNPAFADRMHCVLFVIKATDFNKTTPSFETLKGMQSFLEKKNIPLRIVLTRMDELILCEENPMENIFRSSDAEAKVNAAKDMFDLTCTHILPVANYIAKDKERDTIKEFLALQALDNILEQAVSFIRDNI